MYSTRCSKSPCKLCHGDLASRLNPPESPSYTKTTRSADRRAIAAVSKGIRSSRSAIARWKSSAKAEKRKESKPLGINFLDLPVELRFQIYANCLTRLRFNFGDGWRHVDICGWREGGGFHADDSAPALGRFRHGCRLFANYYFPVEILLLNKAICKEAKEELYRLIKFQIFATGPEHLPQVSFWLTKHPVRYTAHLEVPFMIDLRSLPAFSGAKRLGKEKTSQLANMLARMPNLQRLDILFSICTTRDPSTRRAISGELNNGRLERAFSALFILKAAIPEKIQLNVDIEWSTRYNYLYDERISANDEFYLRNFLRKRGFVLLRNPACYRSSYENLLWRI